jgi:hypothetical protein
MLILLIYPTNFYPYNTICISIDVNFYCEYNNVIYEGNK